MTELECPTCMSHYSDVIALHFVQVSTWHCIIDIVAAIACALASYRVACCWIESMPYISTATPLVLSLIPFVLLNTVEYSVLSNESHRIRAQAIVLFSGCYLFFFVCFMSHLIATWTLAVENDPEPCLRVELEGIMTIMIAATSIRFCRPSLESLQCLSNKRITTKSPTHSTPVLVCLSILSAFFIVLGATFHFQAALENNFGIATSSPLVYMLATPLLMCLAAHRDPRNTACVWNTWSRFFNSYVYAISVAWPICLYVTDELTYSEARYSILGAIFTIVGFRILHNTVRSTVLAVHPSRSAGVYMHLY